MNKNNYKSVQQILNKIIKNNNLEIPLKNEKIFNNWNEIVGNSLAEKCTPIKMENKALLLKAKNHVWKNELSLMKNELLNQIQKNLGREFITNIRFI